MTATRTLCCILLVFLTRDNAASGLQSVTTSAMTTHCNSQRPTCTHSSHHLTHARYISFRPRQYGRKCHSRPFADGCSQPSFRSKSTSRLRLNTAIFVNSENTQDVEGKINLESNANNGEHHDDSNSNINSELETSSAQSSTENISSADLLSNHQPSQTTQENLTSTSKNSSSSSTPNVIGLPTTKQMLVFIATTVLVWVSEPLLSLVDSAVVGRFAGRASHTINNGSALSPNLSSVIQLAALGPATMLCDSSIFLTYFIGLAATNQIARASAKKDWKSQIETSSHVMGVSIALGAFISIMLFIFGEPMLRSIIGPGGAVVQDVLTGKSIDMTEQVVHIALGYTRIRTVAAIFAITGSTAQSLLLCVLDTPTVALAVVIATSFNTLGDVVLVAWNGFGVWGAALATGVASIAANMLLIYKERKVVKKWRDNLWLEKYGGEKDIPYSRNSQSNSKSSSSSIDSTDKRDKKMMEKEYEEYLVAPFISLPDRKSLIALLKLAGPIFFVMVGKLIEFWAMTIRAGNFGMVSLACHNILMRVFFFFGTFGDGLAQAAQTFLPGLFIKSKQKEKTDKRRNVGVAVDANDKKIRPKKPSKKVTQIKLSSSRSRRARKMIRKLATMSVIIGVFSSVAARFLAKNAGTAFTSDTQLVSLMSKASNYMGLLLLLHPLKEMLEGTMIASRDLNYLLWSYGITAALFLARLRFACEKFIDIWQTAFLFELVRIVLFGARAWQRTRKRGLKTSDVKV